MAYSEKQEYKIEVLENGVLQVRRADIVMKDGKEVGRTYHRHCVCPGDSVSAECPRVQALSAAIWTDDVVAAYELVRQEQEANEL